jgi:hypothetical protein
MDSNNSVPDHSHCFLQPGEVTELDRNYALPESVVLDGKESCTKERRSSGKGKALLRVSSPKAR